MEDILLLLVYDNFKFYWAFVGWIFVFDKGNSF